MKILKNIRPIHILAAIIIVHLFILSRIIFFPYPELFIYSYLTDQGLIPYKEILDQHFPGIMFFPVNLATLGLANIFSMRVIHLSLVGMTQVLIYFTGKKLFNNERLALAGNFLFLIWQPFFEGNVLWIDSFIPPILISAFYLLISSELKSKNLFFSGFLLGVALLFKQTVAPLIIFLILYLIIVKKLLYTLQFFIIGILLPIFGLVLWVSIRGIWNEFIYWTFTFNVTTFAEMGRKYPNISGLVKSAPVFLLPFAYLLYVKKVNKKYILLFIFFISSLAFAYARFDFIHLQPALPFAIILTMAIFTKFPGKYLYFFSAVYILVATYLVLPYYMFNWGKEVMFFGELERNIAQKVSNYAGKGDTTFSLGTTPHIYYLTETLPPGRIFVFQFPWFMQVAEERILSGIINDPPKVIVRDVSAIVGGMRLIDYMSSINRYVISNYQVVDSVNGIEIMIKN